MRSIQGLVLFIVSLFFIAPVLSQDNREAAHAYEAFYRVRYADLEEWNRLYWEYSFPILEALQEEGVIEGFAHAEHHSGGYYNIRMVARTYDWASIETFWSEYLLRLEASMPAGEYEALERMIVEHRDEIWDIGDVRVPDNLQGSYFYISSFTVSFADMEEWNETWSGFMGDFLNEAAEEGLRAGWVRFDHNTGGPHNSKHLFIFEDWDDIDDFVFDKVLGTLAEQQPALWQRINALFDNHTDVIWTPVTQEQE